MTEGLFKYSNERNIGFFLNPNVQDSQLKAMEQRERFMQGVYYYANSERDADCRKKATDIFGQGTLSPKDKDTAFFLGEAILQEHGYTGSPFQYFLQNDMDLPDGVVDEKTARIYIGKKALNDMRARYDEEAEYKKEVATVQNELPKHLAHVVKTGFFRNADETKKSIDVLSKIGMWDKIEPSINRARAAWKSVEFDTKTHKGMRDVAQRERLAKIADMLSDENGNLDELAATAFFSAVMEDAEALQNDASSLKATIEGHAQAAGYSLRDFVANAIDETIKDNFKEESSTEQLFEINQALLKAVHGNPSDLIAKLGITAAEAADSEQLAKIKRLYNDPRIERLRGYMQSAMHAALEPSEQANSIAKTAIETGRLLGDSIIPMAGAITATALTKGRGVGLIGQAAAGWAGGLAVSKDSIINRAVAQAYAEGLENPEEYGYYAGLGQAAAENLAGVGTSSFLLFKGVNRFMTKAAAKATTSKILSNAYARATLAWAATTGIEGTVELSEEEIGEALGSMFNAMARATGSNVSEQQYVPLKAIKQMKPHQIASMYVFAAALGLGGAAANFDAAQKMSTDIDKLKAVGYSDKKAREVQAHGIETAHRIEEVSNSNATEEEKEAQIAAIQDERLEYLGKALQEDVANASDEELVKRSKEENAKFAYRALLVWAIQNGLLEQALIKAGYIGGTKQADGNYLVSYNEKDEKGNVKLVTKEWNRNQLIGFMTFLRGTDVHMQLRELSGQLMAMQFAEKVASVEELKIKLANLRDTPITELATIMQHEAITPELFKAFAEKEVANIVADMRDKGMTETEAEMELSKLLPGVVRKDVIQTAKAAEERKQNAIAKGEIKPGQAVEYPGLNISRFDGTTLVAFFNQKITLSQMLEEMMEARLNQQAKNDPELYNKLGTILQGIQNKLKGVQILPKGKTTFSRSDIVEAYSHLAVAEVIANPAYISHLSQREQAVVQDVLGSVFRAQRYKAIAGAWLNYKESAEGKAYLENGGKDLVDIFSEAGFTFGKHLEAKQATEEQKMKALEARNFLPDFNEETKLLENKAEAEQKLAEVNAKEAQESTVIPANESVTGEEIVITPEQKEAEQATTIDQPQPDTSSWSKAEQISYNAYQNIINGTAKVNDYAIYLYYNPMSDAEATQRGIRTLNQDGEENPMYTQGKRLSIFRDGKYSHADGQDRDVLTGEVRTKDIVHSPEVPQFKTNKSGHKADEKGVVYSLPGSYRMHDPIHIWQRTDGTLVVISGRHRLQKAIEAGAEFIPATVFPEVTGRDAAWARMHDFEQNVLDNQASVADTALYVQGVNPKNRKLTEEETKQFTRKGSNSEYGTYIGLHGSSELIAYLAGGAISPDYAYQIAQIAPDNQAAQKVAIDVLVFGDKGIMEAKNAAKIYLDNQQLRGSELFQSLGGAERQEAFMRFLSAYAANKIRMLGRGKRVHSAAKTDKSIREHEAAGIKFDDAASNRAKLNELNAAQEAWKNIGTHPELLEEAKAEFDKTDEGAQQYFDFGGNFSIQAASFPDRFAGHPLAERMSNFMRTEARRYERTLSKQTPEDAATNALFATQSIIHAVDKYVRNGEFKLPRESMIRLKHARALIDKYAQMMKSGKVRSFNKIDKAEQAELLAAMAEAAAGMDADAINAMTPEEYAALKAEVEAEMKPELYRKHARALADDVAKSSYSTPAEITKRMKALAQAAKTGFTNQGLTNEDLQESGYNSQPDASTRRTALKEYAQAKLAELENAEEANRKEFESNKAQTLSALHRIMSEGRIADNTTLGEVEQRQLTELVENEAQDAIEKEARNREFKLTGDKIQQDAKERNERMVRVAATGRIGELLRDMLNETADIVDLYLKTELLKKLKRITDSVKIQRSPSKTLKGKMGAAEYRRMDAIVALMEMSARAKDNALGEIENARRILNESKGEIPEVAEGSLLWEIINNLNEQGITVSIDTLNIELNNREADINVFANLDGMNYAEALNAARGLAGLIYFGRTAWQMKQAAEYERIKAFLDYFYKHTDSELGTSQAIEKGKKKKIGNIFNSSMNDAQLLFALAGHEGLRPVMDEMRRNLAMAQDARNLHIKSITNQIYATYARLIGMKPQTEAGYTDKQLREASNKFSMEFEKWNETGKPNVVREWIDNDGVLKKQEMELSRLQALDLILTYRQQHYQPSADKHGYTEAVLNKLEEYCGTRLMAMGEAFKRTIQNDGTAQVYEERTGIPMYKDPSYWPGSININTINLTSEEPLVNPYNPAGTYNRLKQRVKHTNEAKYQNAFEKWKHAIAEGANYIYLYPITNTLNRMLAHREFANRLHGLIGSDLFSQLRLMLNVLDSSTWQETALRDEANNWAASMLKATAPAVLALNPGTLARQLSAINNYAMLPGIRLSRLPALIALIKQDKSAIKLSDIMQLDSFRARYRDNAEVNDMLGLGPNAKFSAYNKWAKAGMNIIDRLDIWSNAVSACLYYNMLYEQMQEKNQGAANPLSEEEIRNICEQNVSQLLRLVAQPLEKANKSALYWKYGNTWMGSLFLYMSTEMVNKTGMLRATYIKNKAEGMPFHKNAWQLMYKMGLGLGGMTFLIEVGLFLLFSGDLPDDEKEWLAALFSLAIYSAFGQYLSRIPFIGSVTDYYLSPYGQYATSKSQQQNPALSIDKTSAKLLKMMSDNKHYSASEWQIAYTRFVRDLTAVSGVASGLVPQAQWISTTTATLQSLSAAMNTVYPVARSVQMDSWMRNITPGWHKPKKTKERTKSALEKALTPEPEKKKGRKSK